MGYLTGYSIYNKLGFTTQVGNIIQIGKNETRPQFKRGMYTIAFLKQKNTITKDSIPLLQILDTIRTIRKIPDARLEELCKRLLLVIKSVTDKPTLARLAMKYPPSTRALLGALLEELGSPTITIPLLKTLNPITTYRSGRFSNPRGNGTSDETTRKKELFRQALQATSDQLQILPIYVEKDYWVTMVPHELFHADDIGKDIIF
ncbi:MAG: hypothetical protein CSA96_06320 [Bacteroidetes bacterium]|nr:MAG: hypothetical protein CSA96_06320 [Bacteroidota bacterium]